MKLYVNGVQETDFETATYPPQNQDIDIFEQILTTIGVGYSAGSYTGYFDGYLAEFYGIDGQQLSLLTLENLTKLVVYGNLLNTQVHLATMDFI